MPDTTPRLWRTGAPPTPGASRRARLLSVLAALAVLAGVAAGLLYWLSSPPAVAVLPVAITSGDGGPVAWAEQDRAALAASDLLGRARDDSAANPSRDQIRQRFAALAKVSRTQPVVIHLAAPAAVDAAGGVFLLPADGGDSPRNRLTLSELLAAVRDCPARDKLLVLNLTPATADPLFAPPPGDLSAAVFAALDATADDNRLALVACGPGQMPFASPELGRSVFSFYLEAGLKGEADADRDGRLTVRELAEFVHTRVSRWATENRAAPQTPTLHGSPRDFTLRAIPAGGTRDEKDVVEVAYPDWLKAAWEAHDKRRAGSDPWAFRQARAALLAAERDLRAGATPDEVKRDLDRRLAAADQLNVALRAVPTPDPLPTLAAVFPGYTLPEPQLVEQLRTAAISADARPAPVAAKADEKPPEPPLPPEFEPFKAKPHALLAAAVFVVLAEDADPSAGRVRNFAKLLAAQSPPVLFAEVLLVRRLAALADQGALAPWSNERAALALQTAKALEDAASRPDVHAWAKPALDEAYQFRANAEAVLFAPGFASPDEATARLRKAEAAARRLKASADRLQAATTLRDEATLWLTGATPLVSSGTANLTDALTVAGAVGELNRVLTPPAPLGADAFADEVPKWDRPSSALRVALTAANRPLTPEALAQLRKRAGAPDAGAAVHAELDAVLASALVPVAERVPLWNARSAVARRLCEVTLRKDTADWEVLNRGETLPARPAPAADQPYDAELARRRARWTAALLHTVTPSERIEGELLRLAPERFAFADRLRRAWADAPALLAQPATAVRAAAVLPTSGALAQLDQPATNPLAVARREAAQAVWKWQAGRFEYEAREALDPSAAINGGPFLVGAARATAAAAKSGAVPYLEVTPLANPRLTFEKPTADLKLALRAVGVTAPPTARVEILSPAPEWVKPVPRGPAEKLETIRDSAVSLPLAAGDRPTQFPASLGVLVEAEAVLDGAPRTFHRRVPVSLRTLSSRVDLFVRTDPKAQWQPLSSFRVRPNGVPAAYQLGLLNPSPVPQKVLAVFRGLNRETVALTLPPYNPAAPEPAKPTPLVFTSTAPPAPPTPPLAPGAAVPVDDGFRPVSDNALTLELIDPANREDVLQTFALPVAVADPASYLRVSDAVFAPANDGKPNRLSATVVPGDIPGAGPCPVKLEFPPAANPGLRVRDGSQAGSVAAASKPVTLYAENIAFPLPAGVSVTATVSADGVERVFTYAAALPTLGETVRLQPLTTPQIRVNVGPLTDGVKYASGVVPLPVALEVDNPPEGAKLELLIGREGAPVADRTVQLATARAKVAKLRFDPKGEGFELAGSLLDHRAEVPVELLTGRRVLLARLLSAAGAELDKSSVTVVFDGRAPEVTFDPPLKAAKNAPLAVKATWTPSASGLKEVRFFVGKPPKEGELPAAPAPVPGVAVDRAGTEWGATLQMPDTKGIVTVGVMFKTQAGKITIETREVDLLDAAELNKPAPGKIAGKLIENRIAQPTAVVFLYDAKGNPLAKATTKADGTFEFKDLVPGDYYLFSTKVSTNRNVKEAVAVKAGETTTKDLELLLKNPGDP